MSNISGAARHPGGALAARIQGRALAPADPGYDEGRLNWNRSVEQRPALVVEARSASDVAAAVDHAYAHELPVAVKSTGHGVARPCDGGVLIDTRLMRGVSVDAARRRLRVSAGARWDDVLPRTGEVGLAPLAGFSSGVGAVGYTLGGGCGWLARKYGLAIDSVVGAEVVTADGRILQATPDAEPELLFGVKGGHGNYGVVTALDLALVPLRRVYGGGRFYPAERAHEVLRFFRDWTSDLPPEATAAFTLLRVPPDPDLPEVLRGRSVVAIRACALADEITGRELLGPLAALGEGIFDAFAAMPFSESGAINLDPTRPMPVTSHCELFAKLPNSAVDALLALVGPRSTAPYAMVEVRHLGGGFRPPEARLGFRHWDAEFIMHASAVVPTTAHALATHSYSVDMSARLRPYTTGGTSLNFIGPSNGPDAVRRAYTEPYYRELVRLKGIYDPKNVFRFGHNIPPDGID